jgi:hypothetical protein
MRSKIRKKEIISRETTRPKEKVVIPTRDKSNDEITILDKQGNVIKKIKPNG